MSRTWLGYILLFLPTLSFAFDADTQVARASQNAFARNPETKYFSFPLDNDINYGYGTQNRTQDVLNFKPIISFQTSHDYDLIIRTIAPIYQRQPMTNTNRHYINGWGDINPTFFISPLFYRHLIWGVGPTIFIPTATNEAIGSGKWSIGPEVGIFTMPHAWVLGVLTSNVWSVAGDPARKAVDQFSFQYFISYNFPRGWYLTSQPTIAANWKANGNQVWTVPFGGGFGKAVHFAENGISFSLQGYYNAIRPDKTGPNWTLQAKIEFSLKDRDVIAA